MCSTLSFTLYQMGEKNFFYVGNKIVVTNGFVKKTQKTPQVELMKAQKYKKDYERRHQHE